MPEPVRFQLTHEMVDRFADLTGDHSSLHVDETFARRTPFRHRVAHGMLPLMYLSQIDFNFGKESDLQLTHLSGRFITPVFPGDNLVLSVSKTQEEVTGNKQNLLYEFSVERDMSGEVVTSGNVGLQIIKAIPTASDTKDPKEKPVVSIIPEIHEEREGFFSEFEKGDSVSFPLEINPVHLSRLTELLLQGVKGKKNTQNQGLFLGLLASASTSTYVGMHVPGRYATYLELISEWSLQNINQLSGIFNGQVAFLSESANTIVSKFTIVSEKDNALIGRGKIKSRVNQPPTKMPSMEKVISESGLGLTDRVVLVTGASRGIGETIAKMFAAQGAKVVVNYYRGSDDAKRIVQDIKNNNGRAMSIRADVTRQSDIDVLVSRVKDEFGPVGILVNNAAGDYNSKTFDLLSWTDFQKDIDIIVKGAVNCCKAVLKDMVGNSYGKIINLSTSAVEDPPINHAHYIVAKSALMGLTRSLAVEYARYNICVNAVMPGLAETDLTAGISAMDKEVLREEIPMKRHTSPLDIAKTVVFLASEWCEYTTGQQIPVTGGKPPFF